jgi:hypothetical protein
MTVELVPGLQKQLNGFSLTTERGDMLTTEFARMLVQHQVNMLELAYVVANVIDSSEIDISQFAQALGLFAEFVKNTPGEVAVEGVIGGGPAS